MTYVSHKGEKQTGKNRLGGLKVFAIAKEKVYPDGTKKTYVYKTGFPVGFEKEEVNFTDSKTDLKDDKEIQKEKENSEYMNLVRTKRQVQDYCLSNDFDMYWTLTFATEREDDLRAFKRLSNWLDYMKDKYGLFDYIFIPERHKDGCIHFHGVTGGFRGEMVKARKNGRLIYHKGLQVYNCSNWKHGFSEVTYIKDIKKTASYITKYITKSLMQEIVGKGKKKYWSSQGLRKPVENYLGHNPKEGYQPDWENDNVMIFVD